MARAAIILFLVLLTLSPLLAAPAPVPAGDYPLDDSPLAVVRANNAREFLALGRHLHFALLLGSHGQSIWARIPVLASIPAKTFFNALQEARATDLTLVLFSPFLPPPYRTLFFARVPALADPEKQAAFWRHAGLPNATQLPHRYDRGILYLASDEALLKAYLDRRSAPPRNQEAPWRRSLKTVLAPGYSHTTLWLESQWAMGLLAVRYKVYLQRHLRLVGIRNPPAFMLRLTPGEKDLNISLTIPFPPDAETSSATASTSRPPAGKAEPGKVMSDSFPAASEVVLELDLKSLRLALPYYFTVGPQPPGKVPLSAWTTLLQLLKLADIQDKGMAGQMEQGLRAFRVLTGLHPDDDLLALLGDRLAGGTWLAGKKRIWALVAEVREPKRLQQSLRRACAWAAFFYQKNDQATLAVPLSAPSVLWGRKLSAPAAGLELAVLLDERRLVVSNDTKAARELHSALLRLKPRWRRPAWLSWRTQTAPSTVATLAPQWSGLLEFAGGLLGRGEGRLGPEGWDWVLHQREPLAPLSLLCAGRLLATPFMRIHGGPNAERAAATLRLLLSAQQIYRHLHLGELNGKGEGFAGNLADLVDGRGEGGLPLAVMYSKLFDPPKERRTPDTILFAQLVRNLAAGASAGEYRFLPPTASGGKAPDLSRQWILIAMPYYKPNDPAKNPPLVIYANGKIYSYTRVVRDGLAAKALLALPGHPTSEGWVEWR